MHIDPTVFQSTPSVWRETISRRRCATRSPISIHSLRVEGDNAWLRLSETMRYFNPLPPCGGRPQISQCLSHCRPFQSTPSVWRETRVVYHDSVAIVISIHSLRVEGDRCGVKSLPKFVGISIHSLRVEGDALPQPPP